MSGETGNNESGWTTDTLKAHFDTLRRADNDNFLKRFDLAEAAVKQALDAADKASTKADNATEKRFEAVNEFRKTLSDQTGTFMSRNEVEQIAKGINEKIDDLRGTRRSGAASIGALVVGAVVVVGVIVQLVILIATHT